MRSYRSSWMVTGLVLTLAAALVVVSSARAGTIVVPPRPGQVGLSVSGLYGGLANTGDVGQQFGTGPGIAVRVRYRMRYERGFGLTFENHVYDVRSGDFRDFVADTSFPAGTDVAAKQVSVGLYGVEFYQMFGTRTKTTRMLNVGVGLAHTVVKLYDGESQFPWSDGPFVSVGAGLERFFWQGLAWDLAGRYEAIFINGKANHDVQVSLGLIFYASL